MTVVSLQSLADKLLTKFGIDFSVITETLGEFDTLLGEYITTETTTLSKGAFLKSDMFNFNGSFILKDDEKLFIYKSSGISKDSYLLINGIKYKVNRTEEIIFKTTTIVYKSILKEVK